MEIFDCTNLAVLCLNNNLMPSIHGAISSLRKIEKLTLSYNELKEFPESIGSLKTLKALSLVSVSVYVLGECDCLESCGEWEYIVDAKIKYAIWSLMQIQNLTSPNNEMGNFPCSVETMKLLHS